jgi:Leucine-rich repeat (LRR) protein
MKDTAELEQQQSKYIRQQSEDILNITSDRHTNVDDKDTIDNDQQVQKHSDEKTAAESNQHDDLTTPVIVTKMNRQLSFPGAVRVAGVTLNDDAADLSIVCEYDESTTSSSSNPNNNNTNKQEGTAPSSFSSASLTQRQEQRQRDIEQGALSSSSHVIMATAISNEELEQQIRETILQQAVQATQVQVIVNDDNHTENGDEDGENAHKSPDAAENSTTTRNKNRKQHLLLAMVCVLIVVMIIVGAVIVGVLVATTRSADSNGNNNFSSEPPPVDKATLLAFLQKYSPNAQALEWSTPPNYSPAYKAYLWLAEDRQTNAHGNSRTNPYTTRDLLQRFALATLYYGTGGDAWTNKENWLTATDACDWYPGGLCDYDFSSSTIMPTTTTRASTTVPQSQQNYITHLNLTNNSLQGAPCAELALLEKLTLLDLSHNRLQGTLPTQWSRWSIFIQSLVLDHNALTGNPIPDQWLDDTLTGLQVLHIQKNQFSSTLSKRLGELTALRELLVGDNQLTGELPDSMGELTQLQVFDARRNLLTGTLPKLMGSLSKLGKYFVLFAAGHFSFCMFVYLFSLSSSLFFFHTVSFDVASNSFTGTIPADYKNWVSMQNIHFERNSLSGVVPPAVCLSTALLEQQQLVQQLQPPPQQQQQVLLLSKVEVYADCEEVECPCCTHCCTDREGCRRTDG